MPCSATVGTSGKSRQRVLPVTARARNSPERMRALIGPEVCRDEIDIALKEAGNGRRFAAIGNVQKLCLGLAAHQLNGGVEGIEPTPAEPYFRTPGFLRASSISCSSVWKRESFAHADEETGRSLRPKSIRSLRRLCNLLPSTARHAPDGHWERPGACSRPDRCAPPPQRRGCRHPRLWLDHDRLPDPFGHFVAEKAGDDVHVPSRREALHKLDRADRIILRRWPRRSTQSKREAQQMLPGSSDMSHGVGIPDPGYPDPARETGRSLPRQKQATAGASGLHRDA